MVATLMTSMLWRSALKSFVPIVPELVNVQPILEAIRWSPSSFGAQPYNIHVVTDKSVKEELRKVSFDQPQVTECSHLLIFCARSDPSSTAERFISACNLDQGCPQYAKSLRCSLAEIPPGDFKGWATCQTFVALGVGVAAAADARIGACPMGGFVPEDVHRVLKLPPDQWPVAYLAIGSELDTTPSSGRQRYRLPSEELFSWHT